MNRRFFVLILLICLFVSLCGAESRQSELNSILASVNGVPISLMDVLPMTREKEYRAFSAYTGEELKRQIVSIRRAAVDELIDRQLILEDYKGKNIEIAAGDIEAGVDEIADRMGVRSRSEFAMKLRRQGTDVSKVRENVREFMIVQLMLQREFAVKRSVTPREMYERYEMMQKEQTNRDSIELAMILLNEENSGRAGEISRQLQKNPEMFAALASRWSSGPGREDGGKLGRIECRLLRPEFAGALKNPQPGKVYGPVAVPEGNVFLKVLAYKKFHLPAFRDCIPDIRKTLEEEQRQKSRKIYTQRLRKNAVIRYFF